MLGPKLPRSCQLPPQICSGYQQQTSYAGTICFLSPPEPCGDHLTSQPVLMHRAKPSGWRGGAVEGRGRGHRGSSGLPWQLTFSGFGVNPTPANRSPSRVVAWARLS